VTGCGASLIGGGVAYVDASQRMKRYADQDFGNRQSDDEAAVVALAGTGTLLLAIGIPVLLVGEAGAAFGLVQSISASGSHEDATGSGSTAAIAGGSTLLGATQLVGLGAFLMGAGVWQLIAAPSLAVSHTDERAQKRAATLVVQGGLNMAYGAAPLILGAVASGVGGGLLLFASFESLEEQ
jgi:hypothetical protein